MKKRFLFALTVTVLAVLLCALSAAAECPDDPTHTTEWRGEEGGHYLYCIDCGEIKSELQPHVSTPATCQTAEHCTVCGWQMSTQPADHDYVQELVIPATCTDCERVQYRCTLCQATMFVENGAPLGHEFKEEDYVSDGNATCEQDGTRTAKCVRYGTGGCEAVSTVPDEGSALGHEFKNEDYVSDGNATCEQDGTKTAKCVRYGTGGCEKTDTIPDEGSALKHLTVIDWGYPATCTTPGLTDGSHCGREGCGAILNPQTTIPPTGHRYVAVVTEPTCTHGGYTTYTCTACADSYIRDETKPLSHSYGQWHPFDGETHFAFCTRQGCGMSGWADCERIGLPLSGSGEKLTVCPVCGRMSDGTQLELVQSVEAAVPADPYPMGEPILRRGELPDGTRILTVGFECAGSLTRLEGTLEFTLPAAVLEDFTLTALQPDGTESPLPCTVRSNKASFRLTFPPESEDPSVFFILLTGGDR